MAEHMSGDLDAGDRFVRLDDGDMHVVEDGNPGAPTLLLIHAVAPGSRKVGGPQLEARACRVSSLSINRS
jgi:hypothetical protein